MSAHELIVATDETASVATVIDAAEFEAAHRDPLWRAFCEQSDAYVKGMRPNTTPSATG